MRENGKAGFITLFGLQLLKEKKHLTNVASKILDAQQMHIQRAIRGGAVNSRRGTLLDNTIMPIKVSFDYPPVVWHSFTESSPSIQVNLTLSI
jgi:hypothetical protein